MTRSVVDVWNVALSSIGGRGSVSSPEENSVEARICRRHYDTVRDAVQEASWWSSCKQTSRLALLARRQQSQWSVGDPDDNKTFSFRLPNDYLRAWYLQDGTSFLISQRLDEPALHTDTENGVLVYAKRTEDPSRWSVPLYNAIYKMLASTISGPLRGSDSLSQRLFSEARLTIAESQANIANAESNSYEAVPDWIAARVGRAPTTRYVYPFGTSFEGLMTSETSNSYRRRS